MTAHSNRRVLQPSQPRTITHGRPGNYSRGCRCDACTVAWREYKRERRERLGRQAVDLGRNKGTA